MKCTTCGKVVSNGVIDDGEVRHVGCGSSTRRKKVTMTLPPEAVETFKRLGGGNVSEGASIAWRVCNGMSTQEIRDFSADA